MKLEHRRQPLASPKTYVLRQLKFVLAAMVIVGVSLFIGTAGYMYFAAYPLVDAFLNASMILGGMGPVGSLPSDGAKWFASFYALYSGIALMTTVAIILAPVLHRVLHRLHLDDQGD